LIIYAALSLFTPVSNYNVYNYSMYVLIRINYHNWTPQILEILRSCDRPMPGPFSLTGSKMPWVRGWCSSNIDSIHYLGLTNSYKFKFFLLPVRFLMVNRFWNEILLAHLKVTGSWSILYPMNWSARGNVLNQYLRNTSIGTTVCLYCLPVQQFTCGYELIYVIAHKQNLFELWSVILIWFAVSAGNFKTTKWKIFVWCWTVPHRAQTRCLNFIKNNTVVAHFTSPCYPYWTIT
jgi:hypothetical protein